MLGNKLFAAARLCVKTTGRMESTRLLMSGLVAIGVALSGFAMPAHAVVKVLEYNPDGTVKGISKFKKDKKKSSTGTSTLSVKGRGQGRLPQDRFVNRELIVVNPPRNFETSARSLGFSVISKTKYSSLKMSAFRLRTPAKYTVTQAKKLLSKRFVNLNADANHIYDITGNPDAQEFPQIAALPTADAECGRGVRIGMIDGRVNAKHPALAGQKIIQRRFSTKGMKSGPLGHGTAIAAMFVGNLPKQRLVGYLPAAEIRAANVQEAGPSSKVVARVSNILHAIDWLVSEKVHVINFNIAGADNEVLRAAIDRVRSQNIIMVAAVGNWGSKTVDAYPAAYSPVVGVTGVSKKKMIYGRANKGRYVDFAAKGVRVWTAAPRMGGQHMTGTSYATPVVASMVALKVAHGKKPGLKLIRNYLKQSAIDLGPKGKDVTYGWGLIDPPSVCQ